MNPNIKTSLEIYGITNKKIEDTTNMAQSLKDINSERWVSFDWLSRVLLTYDTIEDVIKELQSELEG